MVTDKQIIISFLGVFLVYYHDHQLIELWDLFTETVGSLPMQISPFIIFIYNSFVVYT